MSDGYNGWKNYETWNVALWIQNDEGLCERALVLFASPDSPVGMNYLLAEIFEPLNGKTPDGVFVTDSRIDLDAIREMLEEMVVQEEEGNDEQYDESCAFRVDPPIG